MPNDAKRTNGDHISQFDENLENTLSKDYHSSSKFATANSSINGKADPVAVTYDAHLSMESTEKQSTSTSISNKHYDTIARRELGDDIVNTIDRYTGIF
jgi:hypothetical protein